MDVRTISILLFRFFCDCGAGSTGTPCQLLNKHSSPAQRSSTEYQNLHSTSTRSESRVNSRCGLDVTTGMWQNFDKKQKVNRATEG